MRGQGKKIPWAEWEDRIITIHYPDKGPHGLRVMLPRRSSKAIVTRAYEIGVKVKGHRTVRSYTEEELAIVRRYYAKKGAIGCAAMLEGRTPKSVKFQAQRLGIHNHRPRKVAPTAALVEQDNRPLSFEERVSLVEQGKASIAPALVRFHLMPTIRRAA